MTMFMIFLAMWTILIFLIGFVTGYCCKEDKK